MKFLGAALAWVSIVASSVMQQTIPVDWATITRLLPEAILVGFFMWFTLKRDAAWAQEEKAREALRQVAAAERAAEQEKRDRERDLRWQTFMQEERQWRDTSLKDVAKELKNVNTTLIQLSGQMLQHEASVSERAQTIRAQMDHVKDRVEKLSQEKS